jgi:hypothetical protein
MPEKVPQPHGGALLRGGMPGNKGGGRPPSPFKNFIRELRDNPDVQDALKRAAQDEYSRGFAAAWKIITEYDPERPKGDEPGQKVEIHVIGPPTGVERASG